MPPSKFQKDVYHAIRPMLGGIRPTYYNYSKYTYKLTWHTFVHGVRYEETDAYGIRRMSLNDPFEHRKQILSNISPKVEQINKTFCQAAVALERGRTDGHSLGVEVLIRSESHWITKIQQDFPHFKFDTTAALAVVEDHLGNDILDSPR